jgi:propionyl-CoA carboxylase alpha chain
VIEEAPSPFLDPITRRAMGEQAVALAKAVGYKSAGTVEFIVDKEKNFYFLEMNTRLQVEHPVTEKITGLDLVELMIRVAAGEALPFVQHEIQLNGWAMEARVYAEDPTRNFMPSIGRVVRYRPPSQDDSIRVDTGVFEGGEISMYYDPMIAKVITYGLDRQNAITQMGHALDSFYIRGVRHNMNFLAALINHARFRAGQLSTNFIATEFPEGFKGINLEDASFKRMLAVATALHRLTTERNQQISGKISNYHPCELTDLVVRVNRKNYPVQLKPVPSGYDVLVDGKAHAVVSHWRVGDVLFDGIVDGHRMVVQVDSLGTGYRLLHAGAELDVQVLTPRATEFADLMPVKAPPDTSKYLLSPMPGLLVSVAVTVGQAVHAGEELAVIEAMKMMNILRAERDGKISALYAKAGDSLAVDQKILEFGD